MTAKRAKQPYSYQDQIDPELLSNNQLVSQLFNIINQLPTDLGWIAWIFSFIWHCCIIVCINFIIKHLDGKIVNRVKKNLMAFSLSFLPHLGYTEKRYRYHWYAGSSVREVTIFHERITKFFGIHSDAMQDYLHPEIFLKYVENDRDQSKSQSQSKSTYNMPVFLYTAKPTPSYIDCIFYYWDPSTMNLIEKIKSTIFAPDEILFTSYDFKDKKAISRTIVSNPLIPIKNYQRLDQLIIDFTEIQNCLGHKNVNAISIDGAPGLGKTSFIDYFSNKHPKEYSIIYIDMIKNYKADFEVIFKTIQSKLDSNSRGYRESHDSDEDRNSEDEDEDEGLEEDEDDEDFDEDDDEDEEDGVPKKDKGIIIMIDEIDKYLDMHLEYLHNKGEKENKNNIHHGPVGPAGPAGPAEIRRQWKAKGSKKTNLEQTDWYDDMDYDYDDNNSFSSKKSSNISKNQANYKSYDKIIDHGHSNDIRIIESEDLTRNARYLKKELLYKLFELINMKVKRPSYLLFCTNNFSSMWSDLSEKHYNHLKALHNRFIKIHFEHINKENLIEILLDINKTFENKLARKYLEPAVFKEVTDILPNDLMLTVRQMHHTLIRTMYNIEEFVKIIISNDVDTLEQWSIFSTEPTEGPENSEPSEPSEPIESPEPTEPSELSEPLNKVESDVGEVRKNLKERTKKHRRPRRSRK